MRSRETGPFRRERNEPNTKEPSVSQMEQQAGSQEKTPQPLVERFRPGKEIKPDSPDSGVALMRSSQSIEDWNRNIETIKAAYGGEYPSWWHEKIIASGLAEEMSSHWS